MRILWRPSSGDLERMLGDYDRLTPTYPEVGGTAGSGPAGYRRVAREVGLGRGDDCFVAVAEGLLRWRLHTGAGLLVAATADSAATGVTVLLAARIGPLGSVIPCRVVSRVDEARRRGFAYGTLPGHPETGEEAFTVALGEDGRVVLSITAFSRPATWPVRLAGPVATRVQDIYTDRYVEAARHLAASATASRA